MRFLIECIRLADEEGAPVPTSRAPESFQVVDGDSPEAALATFLARDGFQAVGSPSVLPDRALLTVRKQKALFAVHVAPFEPESTPEPTAG